MTEKWFLSITNFTCTQEPECKVTLKSIQVFGPYTRQPQYFSLPPSKKKDLVCFDLVARGLP